jgi:hypothetical protein
MNDPKQEQILAGFRMLGLETEADRDQFRHFRFADDGEADQDYILIDTTTQLDGNDDAELAQSAQ